MRIDLVGTVVVALFISTYIAPPNAKIAMLATGNP